MRILYVLNHVADGGAATAAIEWLRVLCHTDHTVEVCTIYTDGTMAQTLKDLNITIHNLDLSPDFPNKPLRRKYDLRAVTRLVPLIRRGHYDIVHAQNFPTLLFVALASFFTTKTHYVYTEQSIFNRRRDYLILKPLDQFMYWRFHAVTAVSNAAYETLLQWLPGVAPKTVMIPNAVEPKRFQLSNGNSQALRDEMQLAEHEAVIFFAGRLEHVKGVDVLIDAIAQLTAQPTPPFKVLIAGQGPLETALRQQASQLGVQDKVIFLGFRNDIPDLLKLADIMVLPSRWEGLPLILLEAMASHTPIIASAVGGTPEIIHHEDTGLLVPPEDAAALARQISALLGSPALQERVCKSAFDHYQQHYTSQAVVNHLLDLYENILKN